MRVEPDPEPLSHLDSGYTKKAGSGTKIFKITLNGINIKNT